jgi:hypothetical protein
VIHRIQDINTFIRDIDNKKNPMNPTIHILSFRKRKKNYKLEVLEKFISYPSTYGKNKK